ncbi:hypothetical protein CP364_10605, partial [Lactobacillus sp. UMNPBX13]
LTKFGQSISRLATNFINNLKSGLRFLNRSKIIVRILLLENQELIVNSQPQGLSNRAIGRQLGVNHQT